MGGRVGLKGTDSENTLDEAMRLGTALVSSPRTMEAIRKLVLLKGHIEFVTCSSEMGEDIVRKCGLEAKVIGITSKGRTTAADTRKASSEMVSIDIDLIPGARLLNPRRSAKNDVAYLGPGNKAMS